MEGQRINEKEVSNCRFDEFPCENPGLYTELALFIAKLAYPNSTFSFKEAEGFDLTESKRENTILNQVYNGTADMSAAYMTLTADRTKHFAHMGQLTFDEVCNRLFDQQNCKILKKRIYTCLREQGQTETSYL